ARWFRELIAQVRKETSKEPVLIIVDSSNTAIPWEMFRLHPTQRTSLGSEMVAVRWDRFVDFNWNPLQLADLCQACSGSTLSHLDPDERCYPGVGEYVEPLVNSLKPKDHPDIRELAMQLGEAIAGVGFVYMLCHGFLDGGVLEIGLGSDKDSTRR